LFLSCEFWELRRDGFEGILEDWPNTLRSYLKVTPGLKEFPAEADDGNSQIQCLALSEGTIFSSQSSTGPRRDALNKESSQRKTCWQPQVQEGFEEGPIIASIILLGSGQRLLYRQGGEYRKVHRSIQILWMNSKQTVQIQYCG
jgi:hypothetical protein